MATGRVKGKLAAILGADVAGYSRLMERTRKTRSADLARALPLREDRRAAQRASSFRFAVDRDAQRRLHRQPPAAPTSDLFSGASLLCRFISLFGRF